MKNLAIALTLSIAACTGDIPEQGTPPSASDSPKQTKCLVRSPENIQMWINAMPGPNSSTDLIAEFTVTAPTPGYTFDMKVLEVMERMPPQYVFEFIAQAPDGIVTQVETKTDVRIELADFEYSENAAATVKCGDSTLFYLDKVETAY